MVQALGQRSALMETSIKALRWFDGWLQRFAWIAKIALAGYVVVAAYYVADRRPPFAVLHTEPAAAKAGQSVSILAQVWRDSSRECSAEYSRFAFDSQHVRFDLPINIEGSRTFASAAMIIRIEDETPGTMAFSFIIPKGMASGSAFLQTELRYACNKMHWLWPIEVTTRIPFTVLP